jgi:hypothetical protein
MACTLQRWLLKVELYVLGMLVNRRQHFAVFWAIAHATDDANDVLPY